MRLDHLELITSEMSADITELEDDIIGLDQRVEDLESGGGSCSCNVTGYFMIIVTFVTPGRNTFASFPFNRHD